MPRPTSLPGIAPGRRTRPGAIVVLLVLVGALAFPRPAGADDAIPTRWMEQAGTAPLLHAPPPANPATICVIDTGVNLTPDLNVTARYSEFGGSLDDVAARRGQPGHGTVVAQFAAGAVNGWGGAGVFPHGRIVSVRVFPDSGSTYWSAYVAALDRCRSLDTRTKVAVIALGGPSADADEAAELENRIRTVRSTYGINVVVAAGNGGGATEFPGRFEEAFTVAGVGAGNSLCGFSARGANIDIAAPGCDLAQGAWDGRAWLMSGTSFAAPIVAGGLAALRSYRPDLSAAAAESVLLKSADPGTFPVFDLARSFLTAGLGHLLRPIPQPFAVASTPPEAERQDEVSAKAPEGLIAGVGPDQDRGRLPRPRIRLRRLSSRRAIVLHVAGRRGWTVELAIGRRRLFIARNRSRVRIKMRQAIRARYVTEDGVSRWTTVPNPRRAIQASQRH